MRDVASLLLTAVAGALLALNAVVIYETETSNPIVTQHPSSIQACPTAVSRLP